MPNTLKRNKKQETRNEKPQGMTTISTVKEMQQAARVARGEGKRLALVPTMGALHDGHLSLVKEARKHADHVTVSIYVNPTQFGPSEDFEDYPREIESDLKKLEEVGGVDAVFAPLAKEMYPHGQKNNVTGGGGLLLINWIRSSVAGTERAISGGSLRLYQNYSMLACPT